MAFKKEAAPDIRKYFKKKIDDLAGKSLSDLMEVSNRIYNNRETPEDRQARQRAEENEKQWKVMVAINEKHTHYMARILLVATTSDPEEKRKQLYHPAQDQSKAP